MIEFLQDWGVLLGSLIVMFYLASLLIRQYLRARNAYAYKPNAEVEKLLSAHKKKISRIEKQMSKD